MSARNRVDRHKADIVPVSGIAGARIAKTNEEPHQQPTRATAPAIAKWPQPVAAGGSSAAGTAAAAAAASSRTAEEAAMLAIVKSRSVIVGRQRSGMMTR